MEIKLTHDAEYLLCVLYDAYRQRRINGESSSDAKLFSGSEDIQSDYAPIWPTHDIDEAARELEDTGMLECLFADLELCQCKILPSGIVYMEHRFGDKLDQLIRHIAMLRSMLFG